MKRDMLWERRFHLISVSMEHTPYLKSKDFINNKEGPFSFVGYEGCGYFLQSIENASSENTSWSWLKILRTGIFKVPGRLLLRILSAAT